MLGFALPYDLVVLAKIIQGRGLTCSTTLRDGTPSLVVEVGSNEVHVVMTQEGDIVATGAIPDLYMIPRGDKEYPSLMCL